MLLELFSAFPSSRRKLIVVALGAGRGTGANTSLSIGSAMFCEVERELSSDEVDPEEEESVRTRVMLAFASSI